MCTMLRQATVNGSLFLAAPRLPTLLSSNQLDETSMGGHFVQNDKLLVRPSMVTNDKRLVCKTFYAKICALLCHERGETE